MADTDWKEKAIEKVEEIIDAYEDVDGVDWKMINKHLDKILGLIDDAEEDDEDLDEEYLEEMDMADMEKMPKGKSFRDMIAKKKKHEEKGK